MNKQKQKKQGTLARLLKMLFKFYPVLVPVTILIFMIKPSQRKDGVLYEHIADNRFKKILRH